MKLLKFCKNILLIISIPALLVSGVSSTDAESSDHTLYLLYQQFLDRHVLQGQHIEGFKLNVVDYNTIYKSRKNAASLYRKILSLLATINPDSPSSREDKLAFWINTYNIGAIKMIIDHYPVDSIRSRKISWIKNPWKKKVLTVGGKQYSLDEIEHEILLGKLKEPMVHFSIVCASLSCPNLNPTVYNGANVIEQMETQARSFLRDKKKGLNIDRKKGEIHFSQIFKFDKKTFPKGAKDAVPFIKRFLDQVDSKYLASKNYKIKYLNYNWSLNSLSSLSASAHKKSIIPDF